MNFMWEDQNYIFATILCLYIILFIYSATLLLKVFFLFCSSSQSQSSYIIRNPQQRRISQSQPVRGRDEEQDDIVSADVEEVIP